MAACRLAWLSMALLVNPLMSNAAPASVAPSPFSICYGYECSRQHEIALSPAQWHSIRMIFTPAPASPRQERAQVRRAIAQLEALVGHVAGTWQDLGGNVAGSDRPRQMDCIDESTNTTTYLLLLQRDGLLKWHEVGERVKRSKWLFDIHWSAVLRDKQDGQRYAIDSWFLDNGQPPYIQPLEAWLDKEDFDAQHP